MRGTPYQSQLGRRSKWYAHGQWQGGGAVIAAASLGEYPAEKGTAADGVTFVGFVALAPQDVAIVVPPDARDPAVAAKVVGELAASFSDSVFNFTHFAMSIWATAAAFPGLETTDIFTVEGASVVNEILTRRTSPSRR